MKKITKGLYALFFLFLTAGIADLFSSIVLHKFLVFEANPLFLLNNSILMLFAVKFVIIIMFYFAVFRQNVFNNTDFSRYFYTFMMVTLILIQFFAAFSNVSAMVAVTADINDIYGTEYSIFDVPGDKLAEFAPDPMEALRAYMGLIFVLLLYPLFLGIFSFFLWERLW